MDIHGTEKDISGEYGISDAEAERILNETNSLIDFESVWADEDWWTDENNEEDMDCQHCQGTGIGMSGPVDESKCIICRGRGYLLPRNEDE